LGTLQESDRTKVEAAIVTKASKKKFKEVVDKETEEE
jgi:hypothetical protein